MRIFGYTIIGAALLYETVALATQRQGDTISEIVWAETKKRPMLPFAMGVLMGHFFWQQYKGTK